jgi:hypothetical protein
VYASTHADDAIFVGQRQYLLRMGIALGTITFVMFGAAAAMFIL